MGISTNRTPLRWFRSSPQHPNVFPALYDPVALQNQISQPHLVQLVNAYRSVGHLEATLDPLALEPLRERQELKPETYGVDPMSDQSSICTDGIVFGMKREATPREIVEHLRRAYASTVTAEFSNVRSLEERIWLAKQWETAVARQNAGNEERLHIFKLLMESEMFDRYMSRKFGQVKRYGLEGAEAMIVGTDTILRCSAEAGLDDVVIGMPHRGRLNLLVCLLNFPARRIFRKVRGQSEIPSELQGTGDVASHFAQSIDLDYGTEKPLHVSLVHNPSHLEAVDPVTVGKTRAKLDARGDSEGKTAMALIFHGDASFCGQGVVTETFTLSETEGWRTGGSVHIIVNNQVGFTATARSSRSSLFASDVAKMVGVPLFRCNGDSPDNVALACRVATEFRNTFHRDAVVEIVCYRRLGHNEVDEPGFTQPTMYKEIRARHTVVRLWADTLMESGVLSPNEMEAMRNTFETHMEEELQASLNYVPALSEGFAFNGKWKEYEQAQDMTLPVDSGVPEETLKMIGVASVQSPEDMMIHDRLKRHYVLARLKKLETGEQLDWATAEAMSLGSLLLEGFNVRVVGQDVARGTFSHRHAKLVDQQDEWRKYTPLNYMQDTQQGTLAVFDSPLSEAGVLGFEYGYSLEDPRTLTLWEAQFGDFYNEAQVIVDQFISSGEAKWLRQSGLVLLLPHGYDNTGPEHSCCRMERFLQLIDGDSHNNTALDKVINMHVINPSTPAQYFHALRRQMHRNFRKPLIVVGPKALLRLPACVSSYQDMAPGTHFQPVIGDTTVLAEGVDRVMLCSGKIYYELVVERAKDPAHSNTAIVRIEELAPFPYEAIKKELGRFPNMKTLVWCQEEPKNYGAWSYVDPRLDRYASALGGVQYIGRRPLPCPAVGTSEGHKKEYDILMKEAFVSGVQGFETE